MRKRGQQQLQQSPNSIIINQTPRKMAAFGQGPRLTDGATPLPDLDNFLAQLEATKDSTSVILALVENEQVKAALQQLSNCALAAGHLLRREASAKEFFAEERRLHGVVIGGLAESASASATTRAEEDRRQVCELLDVAGVEALPVVYRMGKRQPPPSLLSGSGRAATPRPRLVKVEFATKGMAAEFLRNRGKIATVPTLKHIFMRPSLPPEQLSRRRDLYKEKAEKNGLAENKADPYVVWGPPGGEALIRVSDIKKKK